MTPTIPTKQNPPTVWQSTFHTAFQQAQELNDSLDDAWEAVLYGASDGETSAFFTPDKLPVVGVERPAHVKAIMQASSEAMSFAASIPGYLSLWNGDLTRELPYSPKHSLLFDKFVDLGLDTKGWSIGVRQLDLDFHNVGDMPAFWASMSESAGQQLLTSFAGDAILSASPPMMQIDALTAWMIHHQTGTNAVLAAKRKALAALSYPNQ